MVCGEGGTEVPMTCQIPRIRPQSERHPLPFQANSNPPGPVNEPFAGPG